MTVKNTHFDPVVTAKENESPPTSEESIMEIELQDIDLRPEEEPVDQAQVAPPPGADDETSTASSSTTMCESFCNCLKIVVFLVALVGVQFFAVWLLYVFWTNTKVERTFNPDDERM